MLLKNFLKVFLPKKLIKARREYYSYLDQQKITYEGKFKSLNEVSSHFHNTATSYYNDEYIEYQNQLSLNYEQALSNQSPSICLENNRFNILTSFIAGTSLKNICILDIGGGSAKQYTYLKFCCPHIKFDYIIMELPEVVQAMNIKNIDELEYITNFNESLQGKIDVVLFGSSLQYFEDYKEILTRAIELKPKFIAILDTAFTKAETFACAQVNMPNRAIPRWVFNIKEIESYFVSFGFEQLTQSITFYTNHNFDNYSKPESESHHYNFIYIKD